MNSVTHISMAAYRGSGWVPISLCNTGEKKRGYEGGVGIRGDEEEQVCVLVNVHVCTKPGHRLNISFRLISKHCVLHPEAICRILTIKMMAFTDDRYYSVSLFTQSHTLIMYTHSYFHWMPLGHFRSALVVISISLSAAIHLQTLTCWHCHPIESGGLPHYDKKIQVLPADE